MQADYLEKHLNFVDRGVGIGIMRQLETPLQEQARLAELYSQQSDEELLHHRASYDELTEAAQDALRNELSKRMLWSKEGPLDTSKDEIGDALLASDRLSVWSCKTQEEAEVVRHLLLLASIEAKIGPILGSGIAHMVHVIVSKQDAERALIILSEGVPQDIVKELAAQLTPNAFVMPQCTKCGSSKVVLDGVEPVNVWLCSVCAARWEDDPEQDHPDSLVGLPSAGYPAISEDAATDAMELDQEAEETRRHRALRSNRRSIILVVTASVITLIATLVFPWTPIRWIGLLMWVPSQIMWAAARIQLGASFSVNAEAHTLITHGLYARIQNPVYCFGGLATIGFILYLDRPWYLLAFLVLVPLQASRIRREREVLTAQFGERYTQYRAHTWF